MVMAASWPASCFQDLVWKPRQDWKTRWPPPVRVEQDLRGKGQAPLNSPQVSGLVLEKWSLRESVDMGSVRQVLSA